MKHGGHIIGAVEFTLCHLRGAGLQLMVSDSSIVSDYTHPLAVDKVLIYPKGGGIQPRAGNVFGNGHRTPEHGKTACSSVHGFSGADPSGLAEALRCGQRGLKGCGCAEHILLLVPDGQLPCVAACSFQAIPSIDNIMRLVGHDLSAIPDHPAVRFLDYNSVCSLPLPDDIGLHLP